jgi:H+/Cl- antiporter ClcA
MAASSKKSEGQGISPSLVKIRDGVSQAARELNPVHPQSSFQVSFLLAAVVVGIGATLYARVITLVQGIFNSMFMKFPIETSLASPLLFVTATWLVVKFAPDARGSGIPQVLEAIDQTPKEKERILTSLWSPSAQRS